MKTLKIRFVARCSNITEEPIDYTIQRKSIFGWWNYMDYGWAMIRLKFRESTKQKLLDRVIDEVLETCKNHVEVIEYPTIKTY